MSLGKKVFAAPARLWMNWPLWGGLLATLLLAKHFWVLFAPTEHAVPGTAVAAQSAQTEQLFGTVITTTSSAPLDGISPIGIFASRKNGFAVMMTATGQVGVGLGGEVAPGVRLVETQADYVILERNGVKQRVDLGKAPTATGGITPATPMVRGITAPPAGGMTKPHGMNTPPAGEMRAPQEGGMTPPQLDKQLLDRLTPEQQAIFQQQQQELLRGRH
jgi:hypothetical protein